MSAIAVLALWLKMNAEKTRVLWLDWNAEQCAFRKCLMNSLAKRDDFRIIAD